MNRRLSQTEKDTLVADYLAGLPIRSAAKNQGVVYAVAHRLLRARGVLRLPHKPRSYTIDEFAFSTVTPESRYWIGMLMTDGYVSDDKFKNPGIGLGLQASDIEHVRSFAAFLKTDMPVMPDKRGMCRLFASSKRLAEDVAIFGVVPRKTHVAKVIGLENNRDFWRGCVDGDGTIGLYPFANEPTYGVRPHLGFCSASVDLIEQFRRFVLSVYPDYKAKIGAMSKGVYSVSTWGVGAIALIRCLYADSAVSLPRKSAVANDVMAKAAADALWCNRRDIEETQERAAAGRRKFWSDPANRERQSLRMMGVQKGMKKPRRN